MSSTPTIHWRVLALLLALTFLTPGLHAQNHTYRHDDGAPEGTLTSSFPALDEAGVLQGFRVPGGGTDQIESLSIVVTPYGFSDSVWGHSVEGYPIQIGVWSDPNGDRNPSDAVLLGSYSGHTITNSEDGQWVTYDFPQPITVNDRFFVGFTIPLFFQESGIAAQDVTAGYRFDSWYFGNAGGSISLSNLQQNTAPPTNAFLFGRFMIRANDGDHGGPIGTQGCPANLHYELARATLLANGYDDLSTGQYRVTLTGLDMPAFRPSFMLASKTLGPAVIPPGSRGNLCLGGNVLRINGSLTEITLARQVSWEVDLGNVDSFGSAIPGFDIVTTGESWSFQAWFRDNFGAGSSNLSTSVTVTFQ